MDGTCAFAPICSLLVRLCSPVATRVSTQYDPDALQPLTKSCGLSVQFDPPVEEKQEMETLGAVASIVQLIALVDTAQGACNIYHSVKWFPRELKTHTDEITAFSNMLKALQIRVKKLHRTIEKDPPPSEFDTHENPSWEQSHNNSRDMLIMQFIDSLDASSGVMLEVQDMLPTSELRDCKRMAMIWKGLMWYLKTPALQKTLFKLERHKSTLLTIMNALDGSVIVCIFGADGRGTMTNAAQDARTNLIETQGKAI